MNRTCRCQFCRAPLDLPQTFRFLVESEAAADPTGWAPVRELPARGGKPMRVCRGCQAARRPARPPVPLALAVGGLLSVGWLLLSAAAGRA